MKGRIFDIKRFALHDGPGIRTTVFLKGCPMNCVWCHNPEGIAHGEGIWIKEGRCIRCGCCAKACEEGALCPGPCGMSIDRQRCTLCDKCIDLCPAGAMQRIDRLVEVGELARELMSDKIFAEASGGGVTLSGGEPLAQLEFSMELLRILRDMGADTCMETSMSAPFEAIRHVPELVDHLIVDIKLFDSSAHRRYTDMPNEQILENFRYLVERCKDILVRVPLIPGITATEENLEGITRFIEVSAPGIPVELINYNPLAPDKYRFLGKEYFNRSARAFSEKEIAQFARVVEQCRKEQ